MKTIALVLRLLAVNTETKIIEQTSNNDQEIAVALGGLALLVISIAIYVRHNCFNKQVVEFESFEVSNPSPMPVIQGSKGKQLSTFSTEVMKETGLDSQDNSPAQHKKRKRKAHRLSDRRRNQQSQNKQQEEQEMQDEL